MSERLHITFAQLLVICGLCVSSLVGAETITRDAVGRILQVDHGGGTLTTYSYDASGNRLSRDRIDNRRTIAVTVDPPNSGTITGDGPTFFNTSASLSASPAGGFIFHHWSEGGTTISTDSTLTFTVSTSRSLIAHFIPLAPEITIEDPSTTPATDLVDGVSSLSFGSQFLQSSTTKTLTIRNTGNAPLTGLSSTIDGAALADFTQSTLPTFIAAGGSVTLNLQFSPSSAGTRAATLHIASADTDENPFDVGLNGSGMLLISTFDEDLTFDDNQVPTGWTLGYPVGGPGRNASIINQRFDVRQVDTYGGLDKAKQVPANAGRVVISYTGNITSNYWGQGTQIRFITTSGEFFTTFGKSGYGAATMSAVVGEEGHQPWAFQSFDPLDVGTYRMTAIFEDSRITYKVTKQGASSPLVDEIVSLPTLQIHNLQTLRFFFAHNNW